MSKYTITFAILAATCILQINSAPLEESLLEEANQEVHSRVRRFTCDVLSVEAKGVKLNDAACAIHCLALKRTGGYCNNQRVCVCR